MSGFFPAEDDVRKIRRLALLVVGVLAAAGLAPARADSPGTATTGGGLTRYQSRLETDAARVLAPEVAGSMKEALAAQSNALWACLSFAEWQRRLVVAAPSLERAAQVLGRRSEVVWAEERVTDEYGSMILQLTTVHAMQRGLVKVLAQLGVQTPAPTTLPTAPGTAAAPAPLRAPSPVVQPVSSGPPPHRGTRPSATPPATPARSPAELLAMAKALDQEAYRILTPELEGATLDAVAARKAELRVAPTVAAWRAALERASPTLAKAGAVLERRAEVVHERQRVLDPFDSQISQKFAVRGLELGLERILAQFGK